MITNAELVSMIQASISLIDALDTPALAADIERFQHSINSPDIWDHPEEAGRIQKKLTALLKVQDEILRSRSLIQDLEAAYELGDELELDQLIHTINRMNSDLQQRMYLSGPLDERDCTLSIHAGAGGIDAQDFAAMLMSMYQAFCKRQDWTITIVSISVGEEGGIKSAMAHIAGYQSYGLLKEEAGVHRLVRISPFNSGKTRETSFALVEVLPDGLQDMVPSLTINEEELKWDYFMAGGKGGQSVNTTYSAVRVTHIPTGISVSCQNERSQQQNKQQALSYLTNKLAAIELQKLRQLTQDLKGQFLSIEWGNHIRSYVLHPYKMIKDHRSGWTTSDPLTLLDEGDLLPVIWSQKLSKANTDQSTFDDGSQPTPQSTL